MPKTKKKRKTRRNKTYKKGDFKSGDGMLTSTWGPALWHALHCISFNYPVKPTPQDKKHYRRMVMNLKFVLPCKYCRINFKKNLKSLPLRDKDLRSRNAFSRWMFKMHEHINKMLGKKSGLKYNQIRERYEHFRARCTIDVDAGDTTKIIKIVPKNKTRKKKFKKEKGCVKPLYGKSSKCIIKIVPKDKKVKTFQMDKKCIKTRKIKK
jgi:hypothetical protein